MRPTALTSIVLAMACHTPSPQPRVVPASRSEVPTPASITIYSRIPEQIGAFRLTQRSTVRGLRTDSLFRYRDGSRTLLTVIIYDVPADIRAHADTQQWTHREGEKFKLVQEIQVQRGFLRGYQLAFSDTTRFVVGARALVQHSVATPVRFASGAVAVEMQFLYLIDGRFVKVRATVPEQGWQDTKVPEFARELATTLASGSAAERNHGLHPDGASRRRVRRDDRHDEQEQGGRADRERIVRAHAIQP